MNNWISANLIWITIAITILVLMYFIYGIIQTVRKKRSPISQLGIVLLILGLLFLIFLIYRANEIEGKDWGQIILTLGLVVITALYTSANVKMAEEMRQQRIIASRPVIIQEAIPRKYIMERNESDYFQIYNAGSSPAIELEFSILNQEKTPVFSERKTTLRAKEQPIQFNPFESITLPESHYYLVCEYQSIFSREPQKTWYQTWLPFELKSKKEEKVYVIAGELKFLEVSGKDRIDAFSSRSKPK